MSYGFLALNDDNDVLISSDTKNLHFAGKATSPSAPHNQMLENGGQVELNYTITLADRTSIPVPFFTMPSATFLYGIAGVKGVNSGSSSKTWTINILRTGSSTATNVMPEVYVFVQPSAVAVSGGYGFQVFNSDGSVSFDSRARPLAVTNAVAVTQPSNPLTSASATTLDAYECGDISNNAFTPVATNSYGLGATSGQPTKAMYHYNSLPQVQREAAFAGDSSSCTGISAYGICQGFTQTDSWQSTYWCFYRGGIGLNFTTNSTSNFKAGWVPCLAGCYWTTQSDGAFLWVFGPGSSTVTGGAWPYSDETINLTAQTVIIGDASRYD